MGHLGVLLSGSKYYKIFINKDGDRIGIVTNKKLIKLYIDGIKVTRSIENKGNYGFRDYWYYTAKYPLPPEILSLFEFNYKKESARVIILLAFIAKLNFLRNGITTK